MRKFLFYFKCAKFYIIKQYCFFSVVKNGLLLNYINEVFMLTLIEFGG